MGILPFSGCPVAVASYMAGPHPAVFLVNKFSVDTDHLGHPASGIACPPFSLQIGPLLYEDSESAPWETDPVCAPAAAEVRRDAHCGDVFGCFLLNRGSAGRRRRRSLVGTLVPVGSRGASPYSWEYMFTSLARGNRGSCGETCARSTRRVRSRTRRLSVEWPLLKRRQMAPPAAQPMPVSNDCDRGQNRGRRDYPRCR